MIPIWAVKPLASAGMGIAKWGANKLFGPQNFGQTAYGRQLKKRMQVGDMPLEARQNVLSGVAKATGGATAASKADMRGRLVASGMSGGLGEASQVSAIDRSFSDRLGDVSERLWAQNEATKATAKNEFAAGKDQFKAQQKQATNDMLGGLLGSAGEAAVGKYTDSAVSDMQAKVNSGDMSEGDFIRKMQQLGIDPTPYLQDEEIEV
jgi:hypothetical protein